MSVLWGSDAALPGSYLLLLECNAKQRLSIGKLGEMEVKPGNYVYVGSAFGPGGVAARLRHHQRIATKPHWHIDYLRAATKFLDAWCVYRRRSEHEWAQRLMQSQTAALPLIGFGSSDCQCATHLFYFRDPPMKPKMEKLLNTALDSFEL